MSRTKSLELNGVDFRPPTVSKLAYTFPQFLFFGQDKIAFFLRVVQEQLETIVDIMYLAFIVVSFSFSFHWIKSFFTFKIKIESTPRIVVQQMP